ncbi:MAG: DUF1800 family protein [Pirellulaceae bacterium]
MAGLEQVDVGWAWQPFVPGRDGPWNRTAAAHLYRRAAFGATAPQLAAAVEAGPAATVEQLLSPPATADLLPDGCAELARSVLATGKASQLSAWWAYVLLVTPHPLYERMTLFWHGHFATSADKVTDPQLVFDQNRLLRQHALGNFRDFTQAISRDPAMLLYLDSASNRKAHPNENYARELMELFCLGEGNYQEKDIQELARCFTGWEVKSGQFRFNRFQHDSGDKTIFGRRDPYPDGSAIDWVVDQPSAAQFIVGKLFRQFVCDEPAPPAELLKPLADELREHAWHIAPVVKRILTSRLFYDAQVQARKIRSPVDLAFGLLRSLQASTDTFRLSEELQLNGQGLLYPPNVKGWDGGRAWINASTILGRANMIGRLLNDEHTRYGGRSLAEYLAEQGSASPSEIVDRIAELTLAVPLSEPARQELVRLAGQNIERSRAIAQAVHALAAMPEFQLA